MRPGLKMLCQYSLIVCYLHSGVGWSGEVGVPSWRVARFCLVVFLIPAVLANSGPSLLVPHSLQLTDTVCFLTSTVEAGGTEVNCIKNQHKF